MRGSRRAALIVAAASAGACTTPTTIASCADDLGGVWTGDDGDRWMILDRGRALEAYPLFDDGKPATASDVVASPRAIDLQRTPRALDGTVRRAFTHHGDRCVATARAAVTSCTGATLELVLADPAAPAAFTPCTYPTAPPSRRVRWRR